MQSFDPTALPGTVTQHLSIFELFLQSDSIVKLTMLLLLLASFWSWAVIFDKSLRLRRLQQAAASFEETFWSGGSLDDLFDRVGQRPHDPMSAGFAESLFATALGLVAAIPAVIAYNNLSTDFGRYAGRLDAFASEFSAILSRQLDERP